jgi:hypothetical protein
MRLSKRVHLARGFIAEIRQRSLTERLLTLAHNFALCQPKIILGVIIQEELVGMGPQGDAFDFADALVVNVGLN